MADDSVEFKSIGHYLNNRRFRIRNFRSIVMDDFITIKPITLLFGKNGTGKSSFIKSIRFVGNNLFPAIPGETIYRFDEFLNLGNFKEVVLKNDTKKDIQIDYEELYQENETFFSHESGKYETITDKQIDFSLSVCFSNDKKNKNLNLIKLVDNSKEIKLQIFPNKINQIDMKFADSVGRIESATKKDLDYIFKRMKEGGWAGYPNRSILCNRESKFTELSENEILLNL